MSGVDLWQTVEKDAIGDLIWVGIAVVAVGFLRKIWREIQDVLHSHTEHEHQMVEAQKEITRQLDPHSPGGLGDLKLPLREGSDRPPE